MPTYTGYRPYGQIASETIVTPAGAPFTGTLTLYAAQTGTGTADAKADATGNAITTISVTAGVAARFHVVEGGEAWVDTAGGRGKLLPNDVGTKAGPAGANGSNGAQGQTGPGVPAGGTTGQVLAKVSSTSNDTSWTDPVAAPATLTGAGLGSTATTAGTVTGTGLATAHAQNMVIWGGRPRLYYDPVADVWPARTVPTGYTGPVVWDSADPARSLDATAAAPSGSLDGDIWRKMEATA